jgi:transcription initiation factor TFIIIB Brf1 subunit/transcription initiation factor TFIIB
MEGNLETCKECGGKLITTPDGMLVCERCGLVYGLSPWAKRSQRYPRASDDSWDGILDNAEKMLEP